MYHELTAFQLERDKMQERMKELTTQKEELVLRGAELQRTLFEMLASDEATDKEVNAVRKELAKAESDVELLNKKIELMTAKNDSRLKDLILSAKEGQDREIAVEQATLNEMLKMLRKQKAEYLAYCVQLHEQVAKVEGVRREFLQACHSVGIHDHDRGYYSLVPAVNLTSTHAGYDKPLAPTENEILDAYRNGKIQDWVRLFIATDGEELDESNEQANRRLRELGVK